MTWFSIGLRVQEWSRQKCIPDWSPTLYETYYEYGFKVARKIIDTYIQLESSHRGQTSANLIERKWNNTKA